MSFLLEELFLEGYLDVSKLILDYSKDLELGPSDIVVLLKILEYIKGGKKVRIGKLSSDTGISKTDVEASLGVLTDNHLYGSIITTNEDGVADERPTVKPLFDKLEDLLKRTQVAKVTHELEEIVGLYESGANKEITPVEYNRIEGFISEGFLPAEISDAIKATIKRGNVNINAVERIMLKNHQAMLEDKADTDKKKSVDLKKALAMIK